MWHYSGPEDSTQSHPKEVGEGKVAKWIQSIIGSCDNPLGSILVLPYSSQNPPKNMGWTNMHSPVPNGVQLEVEEGSVEDNAESDYVEDNKETEEESVESEEEVSSPSRAEPRSQQRHDPTATPKKTLGMSSLSTKRVRGASSKLAEKSAKKPKPNAPKPRKALPRMSSLVGATTSMTSPPEGGEDRMDVDTAYVATSQRATDVIHLDGDDLPRTSVELAQTVPETPVVTAPPVS
ncbi:hypothetical protein ZWY2020_007966 [Hordeum vulgare]|nr:hypothetical protein ZWY2020_007966 [Hordeum vulgare]